MPLGRRSTRRRPGKEKPMDGASLLISGEYLRMQDTFRQPGHAADPGFAVDVLS